MAEIVTLLSANQTRAIAALLGARDVRDAAKQSGISERTIFRWLNDSAFQSAMQEAEAQAIAQAVRRLAALCGLALDTLESVMKSKSASASVKVRAADVVLGRLLVFKDLRDISERLERLESLLGDLENEKT